MHKVKTKVFINMSNQEKMNILFYVSIILKNLFLINKYDIGFKQNWEQVFGSNKYLWPFPVFGESGKPVGDGVVYKHSNDVQKDQKVEVKDKSDIIKKTNDQQDEEQNDNYLKMQKNFIPPQFKQNNQKPSPNKQTNLDTLDKRQNNVQLNNSQAMISMKQSQTNQSVLNTSMGRNNGGGNLNQSFNSAQDRPSYYNNRMNK